MSGAREVGASPADPTMAKIKSPRRIKPKKKRTRRTNAQIEAIHEAIHEVLEDDHPQSVRHVFYRLTGAPYGLIDKTQGGYETVQTQLLKLRRDELVPWGWVSDGTRWRRVRQSYESAADAIYHVAQTYRCDLWARTSVYCEIWCESDSIAGVIYDECWRYNVPLMVARGFSGEGYLHGAARDIAAQCKPAFIYYIGDWDPSGKLIPEIIEDRIRGFAPKVEIHFGRLLVNPDQIEEWGLPTKPPKKSNHSIGFDGGTVEIESVPANTTREFVRNAIEQHLNLREVKVMEIAEESESDWLTTIANAVEEDGLQAVAGLVS